MKYHYYYLHKKQSLTVKSFINQVIQRSGRGNPETLRKLFTISTFLWDLLKLGGGALFIALCNKECSLRELYKLGEYPRAQLYKFLETFKVYLPSPSLDLLEKIRSTFLPEVSIKSMLNDMTLYTNESGLFIKEYDDMLSNFVNTPITSRISSQEVTHEKDLHNEIFIKPSQPQPQVRSDENENPPEGPPAVASKKRSLGSPTGPKLRPRRSKK